MSGTSPAIENAQVTLTATLINNLAAAFVVAGFVAPTISGQFVSRDIEWFAAGMVLHYVGRIVLKGLK
jgi:hypothetical protein